MGKFILILISMAIAVGTMAIVYRKRMGEKLGQSYLTEMFLISFLDGAMGICFGLLAFICVEGMLYSESGIIVSFLVVWTAWAVGEVLFYQMTAITVYWYRSDCKYVYDFVIYNVVGIMTLGVVKVGAFVYLGLADNIMDVIILLMGYFIAGVAVGCHAGEAKVYYEKDERETGFQERRKGLLKGGVIIIFFSVSCALKSILFTPIAGVIAGMLFFATYNRIKNPTFREKLIENE